MDTRYYLVWHNKSLTDEAEDIEDQGRRGAGEGAIDDPEREHCCCNDPAHFQRLVHAQDRGDGRKQVSCR